MKKYLLALPAVLLLSSCGVTQPARVAVPDIPFSADAEISYSGETLSAQITRSDAEQWEFRVTAPYALEGLVMTLDGDSTALSMLGMESVSDVSGDEVSMAKAVVSAYEAAVGQLSDAAVTEKGYSVSGSSEAGGYTVALDKDCVPVTLTADCGRLTVELSSFRQLPPAEREAQIIS
ncbi:MAG: hypothetical protein IK093_03700 [Ruminiclostridium sp.]|nr:hypothetical protein [Ruminiclostridium sp.]